MVFPRSPETAAPLPEGRRRRRRRREAAEADARQPSRPGLERRRQRIAIIIGAALILVVLAIVGVGYYVEFYRPPRVMAGEVRDVRFTMGDLVDRIRVLQGVNRYQGGRVDLSTIPFEYLQDMVHSEILRQAAPGLGFSVTEADVDEELRRRFRPVPPEGQEVDPGQLDQEYENALATFLTATRLSEDEYRVLVEEDLLRERLAVYIDAGIPETMQQVEVGWIRLEQDGPVAPQDVRDRLEREDFAAVAGEVNVGAGVSNAEGYVGWVPQEAFPDLDDTLFGNPKREWEPLPVGEISDPVYTQTGVYIVQMISGPEERSLRGVFSLMEMDGAEWDSLTQEERQALSKELQIRGRLAQQRVDQWFDDQLSRGTQEKWARIKFDSDLYAWVADQVQLSAPRIPQGPPQSGGPGFP